MPGLGPGSPAAPERMSGLGPDLYVTEAKLRSNFFLTDLPPGICPVSARAAQRRLSEGEALTGKSAKGVVLAGEGFPRQPGSRLREPR